MAGILLCVCRPRRCPTCASPPLTSPAHPFPHLTSLHVTPTPVPGPSCRDDGDVQHAVTRRQAVCGQGQGPVPPGGAARWQWRRAGWGGVACMTANRVQALRYCNWSFLLRCPAPTAARFSFAISVQMSGAMCLSSGSLSAPCTGCRPCRSAGAAAEVCADNSGGCLRPALHHLQNLPAVAERQRSSAPTARWRAPPLGSRVLAAGWRAASDLCDMHLLGRHDLTVEHWLLAFHLLLGSDRVSC